MKKFAIVFITILSFYAKAQTIVSKDGEPFLPEAKDWGISIDATKLIKTANFSFVTDLQTISGKYFLTDKSAIRAGLRLGFDSWTSTNWVPDRSKVLTSAAYPSTYPLKENKWSRQFSTVGLSFGYEKRRGKTKLQGIYGAEIGFYFATMKDKFTYANKLNASSGAGGGTVDSTYDAMTSPLFGKAQNIDLSPAIQGVTGYARMIERTSGVFFSVVTRAFVGAEYFIIPKLSIGGEFGWGPSFSMSGRSKTTFESIGISTVPGASSVPSVKQSTFDGPLNRSFTIDTDNFNTLGGLSATLRVNLYF